MFDPVAYINAPRWRASSLGLDRIELLLEKLGNPQYDFRVIHVAGTNGKGSTCAYLDAILRAAGCRTGLFTSPYIERFAERIRIDGEDISDEDLMSSTLLVRDAAEAVELECGEHPTEFELMFAVACVHFSRAKCERAVIEVGLGGRLDATNVVDPELAVITRIGLDHTDILGSSLAEIAAEKAGIIKRGVPVVSYPQEPEAMAVIEEKCAALGCELDVVDFSRLDVGEIDHRAQPWQRRFAYRGEMYETRLLGRYQPENAACAIDVAHALGIDAGDIREGIAGALWPGRFEVLGYDPLVIVDGSHNPQGADALAASLAELRTAREMVQTADASFSAPAKGVTFVVGVLADKDYPQMVAPLLPFAKRLITYAPDNPRALAADDLAREIRGQAREDPSITVEAADSADAALARALFLQKKSPEGIIVAFGTLYSIGDIKRAYRSYGAHGA